MLAQGGTLAINGCNLTREEFIECVVNYRTSSIYQERFAKYAGEIYDVCMSKNINPILCAADAGLESNFGAYVPGNSPYNYWGIGVYNGSDSSVVGGLSSVGQAAGYWCDLILKYQTPGNWYNDEIIKRSTAYKVTNNKFTGSASNVYDLWTIYCRIGWST